MNLEARKRFLFALLVAGATACLLPEPVASIKVSSVVTPAFFNGIKKNTFSGCKGKRFYTRGAFLKAAAAKPFKKFGQLKTTVASKREIAAFFAHLTHESGHFCYIEEIGGSSKRYCKPMKKYPCQPGRRYYGRGPIQITWNYNYGAAGKFMGLNLLKDPGLVARNPDIAFRTALWYWLTRVRPVIDLGFGATIRAINGGECNGGLPKAVKARVKYYKQYCRQFRVTPGPKLTC